ncbi:MAG: TAXI family TRAP transporter solute-binding subunit [Xanthobacteraceae bacterium]
MDFGVTNAEFVQRAYAGKGGYQRDGPLTNLRVIARIESPAYLMIAATRSSGITDLRQIAERKMPVRIMAGVISNLGSIDAVLKYYGFTSKDVASWGGKILVGNALLRNPDFDVIMGIGVLANYPEGGMWYEMTQKKGLVFLPVPQRLREQFVRERRRLGQPAVSLYARRRRRACSDGRIFGDQRLWSRRLAGGVCL